MGKDGQHNLSLKHCKLKQQQNITAYLSQRVKISGKRTVAVAGRNAQQQVLSFIAGEMRNGSATAEDSSGSLTKSHWVTPPDPAVTLPGINSTGLKTEVLTKQSACKC